MLSNKLLQRACFRGAHMARGRIAVIRGVVSRCARSAHAAGRPSVGRRQALEYEYGKLIPGSVSLRRHRIYVFHRSPAHVLVGSRVSVLLLSGTWSSLHLRSRRLSSVLVREARRPGSVPIRLAYRRLPVLPKVRCVHRRCQNDAPRLIRHRQPEHSGRSGRRRWLRSFQI